MDDKEVRERILEGAEGLFMKYGIRSVSMDDIARQLGISKKTLYQHFADKDDMIQQVSLSHLSRNQQEMEDMRRQAVNAIDELALISVALRKGMEELNPSLLFDLKKYHPKAWSAWQGGAAATPPARLPAPLDCLIWRREQRVYFRTLPADEALAFGALRRGRNFGSLCNALARAGDADAAPARAAQ
ncbi:MAG TPA: helix-turn-helix domain-containing protein, partial [Saprospiraceae bacterium]|nr:helix-turn-helix domain-containing protein [Saprospiraceae bacterium]